ncbi:MAG: hypothetical protein RL754_1111 [Bacteroidota bacterium]
MAKILAYVVLAVTLLLAGGGAYVYFQKDAIISGAVNRLNEQLVVPVEVAKVDLDIFSGFPRLRLSLEGVRIADPLGGDEDFIQAREVGLGFNIWTVINGRYTADELVISDGQIFLYETGAKWNWDILKTATDPKDSTEFNIEWLKIRRTRVRYEDRSSRSLYNAFVKKADAQLKIGAEMRLDLEGSFDEVDAMIEGEQWLQSSPVSGQLTIVSNTNQSWKVNSSSLYLANQKFQLSLDENGGEIHTYGADLPVLIYALPLFEVDAFEEWIAHSDLLWKGSYEEWNLTFSKLDAAFILKNPSMEIPKLTGSGRIVWGSEKRIEFGPFKAQTKSGQLDGTVLIEGNNPLLRATLNGESELNELFTFVDADILKNPTGIWKGTDLNIAQRFNNWDDFETAGSMRFTGNVNFMNCAFGISESNIQFDKVEAALNIDGKNIQLDNAFVQSGDNNAVLSGMIFDALVDGGRPQVKLRLESPYIDIDPLLFWEFENNDNEDDFGFDFAVDLDIKGVNLGDFNGTKLVGTIFNRGVKILGKEMSIEGCSGKFIGNWALAEQENGESRFWSQASAVNVDLAELLSSFNNFEIEDLDASNLSGRASSEAELVLYFDKEWELINSKTLVDGSIEVRDGQLKNYAPLEELSTFVDSKELERISFPSLKTDFKVVGDTLFIPETKVENSALNLWVAGWQNLETDDIRYSVRLGLKDLAMRGKNSNRDLGNWIQEAENENQPYVRLLIGCNLDDVCISLDRETIRKSIRKAIKDEKDDLKTLFKRKEETEKPSNSGRFEMLWPEDSLSLNPRILF